MPTLTDSTNCIHGGAVNNLDRSRSNKQNKLSTHYRSTYLLVRTYSASVYKFISATRANYAYVRKFELEAAGTQKQVCVAAAYC